MRQRHFERFESPTQSGSSNNYAGVCTLCRAAVPAHAGVLRTATTGRWLHLVCAHCDSIPTPTVAERLSDATRGVVIAGRPYSRNRYAASCASCGEFVDAGAGIAFKPHPRARWRAVCAACIEASSRDDTLGRTVREMLS